MEEGPKVSGCAQIATGSGRRCTRVRLGSAAEGRAGRLQDETFGMFREQMLQASREESVMSLCAGLG